MKNYTKLELPLDHSVIRSFGHSVIASDHSVIASDHSVIRSFGHSVIASDHSVIAKARQGFTLVEMLVVIGILAILIGIGVSSFSSSTKKAQKVRGQELVSNVATALEAVYQREGSWPRRILANGASDGQLDENVAFELAKRNVLTLTYDKDTKKTTGLDRCGVVTPWAQDSIKNVGQSANSGTHVKTGGTVKDHILHYAVDTDGDGYVDASVGGVSVHIRGSAAVWSCGMTGGEIKPYKAGGKAVDIYSWTSDQVKK